jgi:hypothetical protein
MARALKVIILDKRIKSWLQLNNPKALQQCERAVKAYEGELEELSKFGGDMGTDADFDPHPTCED